MRIDKCPHCGNDNIEASAKIYVSKVVFEDGQLISYDVDFVAEEVAIEDAFKGEGSGFSDLNVYCDCGADLNDLFEASEKPEPKPTTLVIRHPDYETETYTDTEMDVIVFDLGAEFDGPKQASKEELREWIAEHRKAVEHLPRGNAVREAAEEQFALLEAEYLDDPEEES